MSLFISKSFGANAESCQRASGSSGVPVHEEGIEAMYGPSSPTLADLITWLTSELARIRDGINGHGTAIAGFEQWDHTHHVYLEALLPGLAELDAELCIQSGHVFVTVNRNDD